MTLEPGDLLRSKYSTIQHHDPVGGKRYVRKAVHLMVFLRYHEIWDDRYMYVLAGEKIFVVSTREVIHL